MTLEQGWLHALILAHLWKHDRPRLSDREAAELGIRGVRVRSDPGSPYRQGSASPSHEALRTFLRSLHRDAWAS